MKRALLLFCAVALVAAACSSGTKTDDSARVIVLGIDGGTWNVIEPMMQAGELPNIKKLYDSGLHGILESRPPILSPVVWTTIFTGFGFQKHGVKDWKTSQSTNRRVNAIWEILRDQKKRVDVFNVPATWPPDPIPGSMLSGFPLSGATFGGNTGQPVTREDLDGGKMAIAYKDNIDAIKQNVLPLEVGKWTPWFAGKVASRPSFRGMMRGYRLDETQYYLTPLYRTDEGLVASEPKKLRSQVSEKIGEPYIPEGPGWSKWAEDYTPAVLYQHLEQVFSIQSKAALLYAPGDWKLFLYVMTFVDRISHPYWAYSHPENFPDMNPDKAKKYGGMVADAYRRSDEELGKILAAVKGTAPYVVVVSDHGFQASADKTKMIGTHNPDGIYMVSGPGITPKAGVPKFIEDVTPTLLYLMGMPVGQDMDGSVFAEVEEMVGRKVETVASYEKEKRDSTDKPVDNDTWESLRGLGYVDGAPPRAQQDKQPPRSANQPGQQRGGAMNAPAGQGRTNAAPGDGGSIGSPPRSGGVPPQTGGGAQRGTNTTPPDAGTNA